MQRCCQRDKQKAVVMAWGVQPGLWTLVAKEGLSMGAGVPGSQSQAKDTLGKRGRRAEGTASMQGALAAA